jgi:hypothetical protein
MAEEEDDTKILFQNHQWAVTDHGVESVKPAPTYHFNAERLLETNGAGLGQLYDWPIHMAEKTWVDTEAFIDAFLQALKLHAGRYEGKADPSKLSATIDKARQEARR